MTPSILNKNVPTWIARFKISGRRRESYVLAEDPYEPIYTAKRILEFCVFLPFNEIWEFILMTFLTLSYFLSTSILPYGSVIFGREVFLCASGLSLIDVATTMMHRTYVSISEMREFKKRPVYFIIGDSILVIPVEYIFSEAQSVHRALLIILLNILRAIRLLRYYGTRWWGWIVALDGTSMPGPDADIKDIAYWYIMSVYFVVSSFTTIGFGDLVGTTTTERICSIFIIFVGYGSLTGVIANFTSHLTLRYKHNSQFNTRLKLIKKSVESSRLKGNVEKFYHCFWRERRAISEPALIQVLPDSIQEDVYFDIFKNPLQKCYIFEGLPASILKKISRIMRFGYYLPGDMVVERNVVTSTMIYISLGVVQVLTDEDDESPVFAMTHGTILNSSHLLLIRPAKTNVKAVKYTITNELNSRDLFMLLKDYPDHVSRVMANHKEFVMHVKKWERILKNREHFGGENVQAVHNEMILDYKRGRHKEADITKWPKNLSFKDSDTDVPSDKFKALELYVISQERIELVIDDACVITIFPWVLEPSSQFVSFWQILVFVVSLLAVFIIPLNAAFSESNLKWMSVLLVITDAVVIVDVALSFMIAQEVPGERISTISGIARRRFQDPWFFVDLLAALPLHLFFGTDMKNNTIFRINILLNFRKINVFLVKLQNTYMLNLTLTSILKYITFFFLASVWLGSLFYMVTCFPVSDCKKKSWLTRIEDIDKSFSPPQVRYTETLSLSIYFGVQLISEASLADILPYTWSECIIVCIYSIVGLLIFCYLVADYSSALTLRQISRFAFREVVASTLDQMKKNNILENLQSRAIIYLEMLWLYNEGYEVLQHRTLLWDAPKHLIKDLKIEECYKSLMKIPYISTVSRWNMNVILDLCPLTKTIIIPPEEIIMHSGQVCRRLFVIENGVCQLINSQGRVIKTLFQSDNINCLELFLRKQSLYNAKTLSHCQLVCVSEKSIKHVLASNLEEAYIRNCEEIIQKVLSSQYSSSLFESHVIPSVVLETLVTKQPNFYSFSTGFQDKPNLEYLEPFIQFGVFGMVAKLLLMSRTISPGSKFHMRWETGRSICAFITCLLFPHLNNLTLVMPFLLYVAVMLDLLAILDMYVQIHICYFNNEKILITHPLKTFTHYIKTSFILDLIAVLPINYFLPVSHYPPLGDGIEWTRVSYPFADFVRMNRLVQVWRFLGFFSSLEDRLVQKGQMLIFIKYFLLILIFLNTLSAVIISNTLVFLSYGKQFKMYTPTPYKPWILMFKPDLTVTDLAEMLSLHVYSFYFASQISMSAGLGDVMPQDSTEMIVVIIAVAISYLFFNYILVIVSNMRAAMDKKIALYQDRMRHFLHFVDSEGVSASLKRKLVGHFEYVWSQTKGIQLNESFCNFHESLQGDCLMNLYKSVLLKTTLFRGMPEILLRDIAVQLQEKYFYSGTNIVQKNDIINYVLILYEGEVCVIDSLGVPKRPLDQGSMFGNFDDSPRVRTTLGLLAKTHATVLKLESAKLYELAKDYPLLLKRLELTVLQNRIYVRSASSIVKEKELIDTKYLGRIMSLMTPGGTFSLIYTGFMTMLGICSIYLYVYGVSFHVKRLFMYFFVMDILFSLEIALKFVSPYEAPSTGEIIMDPKLIRKRYISTAFFHDLAATLPLYLILEAFPQHYQYMIGSFLAINRLLRITHLYRLLNANLNKLNVNVLLLKSLTIAYTYILLSHVATSVWHIFRCTAHSHYENQSLVVKCVNEMNGKLKTVCNDNNYFCSFYFAIVILTGTGYGDIMAADVPQIIYHCLMVIMSKFVMAIFLGDISNAAQCLHQRFLYFSFEYAILQGYLEMNNVSKSVKYGVLSYAKTLWSTKKGVQESELLINTPGHLKEELFNEIYGHHFKSNFLFVACQDDFYRQFLIHLRSTIYQPGNIVIYEGIINETLYIIHQGSVDVYSKGNVYVETLGENSFFGMAQGLFEDLPHKYIYRVKAVSVILSLKFHDWKHLLDFFPASKNEIYYRAGILGINPEKQFWARKRKHYSNTSLITSLGEKY